ncbi:MAG: cellulase family glycosylhydrolase [Solirubrobacteraceae bacterium]
MRVFRGICVAVAGLVAAAALVVVPAAGAASPRVGVQISPVYGGVDPATVDAELDVARRTGARLVRVEVPWASLEPRASGEHDPDTLAMADHAMAAAGARGLRVILFMTGSPCWASAAPASVRGDCSGPDANRFAVTRYPPRRPADYVPVATFMAKRYGRALAAFEIWNEPDLSNELFWAGPDKVRRYVRLTRALYRPLKRANPKMTVLAGAFVGYQGTWLRALYRAGIKGHYDALSMHFYAQTLYGLRLNHAVQRRYHDRKPVWVTESGWTSCAPQMSRTPAGHQCVTQAAQGRFVSDLVTSLRRKPRYVRALIDYQAADGDGGDKFGLVDDAGAAKPALGALFAALRPKPRAARRVRVRLAVSGGRVVATGTGPAADAYVLQAVVNGRLRYSKAFYLGPDGTYSVRLPAALGRVMAVQVTFPWLGTSGRASIGTS